FLKTAAAPAEAPSVQVSSQTCGRVNDILEDVVQKGTGMGAGIGGYRVAGKTGTAEKAAPGSRGYARNKYVASFVGYLPASHPQVAILVVLDEPRGVIYGGTVAAPAFREIARTCVQELNLLPDAPLPAVQVAQAKKGK